MVRDAMRLKMEIGRKKVLDAIEEGDGTAIYGAHLLPHLSYLLPAILASGIRLIEITYGNIYIDRFPPAVSVHEGGRYDARKYSNVITTEELAKRVSELRRALGENVFFNVGAPGAMNSMAPAKFTDEGAFQLSAAGADGLHVHLSSLEELKELTEIAHSNGLLVEAYIHRHQAVTDPFSYMGIPAETPDDVADAARAMDEMGVDIIGLMFSSDPKYYSQDGASDVLPDEVGERLAALRGATAKPVSVEGQITPGNAPRIRELGGNILVLGTHFDLVIEAGIKGVVDEFTANLRTDRSVTE